MDATEVIVGIPAVGDPTWGLLDSLLSLRSPTGMYRLRRQHDLAVDLARNLLVKDFLELRRDWMFWVDKDAYLAPGTLERLMQWNELIVGALCFSGSKPTTPTVYKNWVSETECEIDVDGTRSWIQQHNGLWTNGPVVLNPAPEGSLYPIKATGCHCLLVHRTVFERIEPPWFQANPAAGRGRGEDLYFFRKVHKAGLKAFVDRSVVAGHMEGKLSVGCLDFLAYDSIVDWESKGLRIHSAVVPQQD